MKEADEGGRRRRRRRKRKKKCWRIDKHKHKKINQSKYKGLKYRLELARVLWFFSICRYRYLSHMCGTCVKGYSPLCLFKNQKEREREKKKSVFFFISCIYRVFFFSCLLHEGLH